MELEVDGLPVDLIDTIRLFQRDPYPGGHGYSLRVTGAALATFKRFGVTQCDAPSVTDQQSVFFAIESVAAGMPGEGRIPARFIFNSVERIQVVEDVLVVTGVCSVPT